ncbi:MAG: ATP-binding cassette domain-containing protein [Candidatus Hydrogenedentota bacterium]
MTIVHVEDIWFERKATPILHGISWHIEHGSHWALLGANGAGKTTLLKIVTGYEWPTRGAVHVLGKRFGQCNIPELRKKVGWVSSSIESRFPESDTALDVVISGLEASLGVYRAFSETERERGRAALQRLNALPLAHHEYATLSQGERQRVLIARALIAEPQLMVLDEPCIGLDPAARYRLLNDLSALAATHTSPTIIYVTHHIEEIGDWIENILVLKNGSILAQGAPNTILSTPVLSKAFGAPCKVKKTRGTYTLLVTTAPRG